MNIPRNSLVLYKNAPALVNALGEKLEIALADGRSLRVRLKDVLLLHPGPLQNLREVREVPNGDIDAACELLDGGQTTLAELAELVYGAYTPLTSWATWQLVSEGLYFHGTPEAIHARPFAEVAEEQRVRAAKAAEREAWNAFVQRARAGRCLPEDARYLREVEEVFWGEREQSRVLPALDCNQTPESAHALLLRIGYWDTHYNPWPRRAGVSLEAAQVELPTLPSEARRDLTHLPAFAIDDFGNLDPDDAISLDGERLWVHIADVAALVGVDSPADLAARERAATLYLPEITVRMLPECTLQQVGMGLTEISPALSFGMILGADGVLRDIEVVPSWVRVQRCTYEDVDAQLDCEPFAAMWALAERYQLRRRAQGAVFIELPEVNIRVAAGVVEIQAQPRSKSRTLVAELMIMAGEATGRFALEHELPVPFSTQDAPSVEERQPRSLAGMYALRRTMRPRQYSSQPGAHAGLGLEVYAQLTSPMRRYLDLVVHQQLRALLRGVPYMDMQTIITRIGATEAAMGGVRRAQRFSDQHWLLVYLQQQPNWQGTAILVEKRMPRSTVLIPELALETRVKVAENAELDSPLTLRLNGVDLPAREAYFRVVG